MIWRILMAFWTAIALTTCELHLMHSTAMTIRDDNA